MVDLPEQFMLADKQWVPLEIGTRLFNYYDMVPCTITRLPTRTEPDTSGIMPDGIAWWVDTDTGSLDGSRMITLDTARTKGWYA